jgi:hypothetical protein
MSSAGIVEATYSARYIPSSGSDGPLSYVEEINKTNGILASQLSLIGALEAISELSINHQKSNWDGYGAQPISEAACNDAKRFLTMLPEAVPIPEIVPEPDGNIALEWYISKYEHFFISFSGNGVVTFVGMFGKLVRSKGIEYFFASIPLRILHEIRQIIELGSHK